MDIESSYYYLGGDPLHTGQYVDLIQRLGEEGLPIVLVPRLRVSLSPFATLRAWSNRHFVGPNPIAALRDQAPAGVHYVPVWSLFPGLSIPFLARILGPRGPRRRVLVHARQLAMARLALAIKRWWPDLRVISELEGDRPTEIGYERSRALRPSPLETIGRRLQEWFFSREQHRMIRHSDAVICVSHNLKQLLTQRHHLTDDQARRLWVFPTSASRKEFYFDPAKRQRIRTELAIGDRFLVIYSGNLRGPWQVPAKLVEAFVLIKRYRPSAQFLILTPEGDRRYIEGELERAGVSREDHRFHSCQHMDVVDYLCASDLGLLLRERHVMNEVASPGKFAEYALSGLPILTTEGIGDFSAQVRDSALACVLPDVSDLSTMTGKIRSFCLRDFTAEERMAFSRWSADRFATELFVPQLADLYRTL